MQQSSRVSRWMTCGVSQTTKLRAHLLASGWQDDMQSFSNSKTQKRPQTRRFSQSRALCEPCGVLPEECTCACPQILVAVPVFPLCTANLQCEKGRSGFSPLVSPQTLLDETPGPIDDLGPGLIVRPSGSLCEDTLTKVGFFQTHLPALFTRFFW